MCMIQQMVSVNGCQDQNRHSRSPAVRSVCALPYCTWSDESDQRVRTSQSLTYSSCGSAFHKSHQAFQLCCSNAQQKTPVVLWPRLRACEPACRVDARVYTGVHSNLRQRERSSRGTKQSCCRHPVTRHRRCHCTSSAMVTRGIDCS
jgi:hypothetical protein